MKIPSVLLVGAFVLLFLSREHLRAAPQSHSAEEVGADNTARVVDIDENGKNIVLREGTNDFSCMQSYFFAYTAEIWPTSLAQSISMAS